MRTLYLNRQLRDSLSWRNVAEFQPQFWVLVSWLQFYMKIVIKSQCFYENCCNGVTPRFHGYGDVTATYIRRSENAPTYIR